MSSLIVNSVWVNNDIKLRPHATYDRWYNIVDDVIVILELDDLRWITYNISKLFWFDGRSGGKIPDLFEPNIGSQLDIIDWLIHDVNAYNQYFSYSDSNEILRQMRCKVSGRFKARCVKIAVSTSKKWFGIPKPNEREFINMIGCNNAPTFNISYQYFKPNLNGFIKIK